LVSEEGLADFERFRNSLPPWTLILVISGLLRRPDEKIAYEEKALNEILKNEFPKLSLIDNLPNFPGLWKKVLPLLRKPWPKELPYWKNRYKGACQSLFFITRPIFVQRFINMVEMISSQHEYPIKDIGGYIQPIEHNRACHLEFNFFYDPESSKEVERIRGLYINLAKVLLKEGALFTRPYGELASLVYERASSYTMVLRRVKKIFDPNNIMNPGNLCF